MCFYLMIDRLLILKIECQGLESLCDLLWIYILAHNLLKRVFLFMFISIAFSQIFCYNIGKIYDEKHISLEPNKQRFFYYSTIAFYT